MTNVERKKIELELQKYLLKYGNLYNEAALKFIKDNFFYLMNIPHSPDILLQIYSEIGVYKGENDIYNAHLNNIKKHFDISGNILEVAGGMFPAFGNLLAKEQLKLNSGTVTVMDPELIINSPRYSNMKLVKSKFESISNLDNFDLVVGIYPCEATENIIIKSCESRKNFYLAMCGCVHFSLYNGMVYGYTKKAYQKYIIDLTNKFLEKYDNGTLEFDTIDSKFGRESYPILYNKKS